MDNDDVTIIVIMNGINAFKGTPEHSMKNFIAAKKRQLALQGVDVDGAGAPKRLRRIT